MADEATTVASASTTEGNHMEVQDQANPEISRRVERVDSSDVDSSSDSSTSSSSTSESSNKSDVDSSSSSDSSGSIYSDSEDSDATTGTAGTALGGIDAVASSTSASTSTSTTPMPVAAAVAGGGQQQQQLQSTVTQRPRCGPSPKWHDYFLHSKERISGSYNVPDAIEFVGQKHCCNGVLIYGTKISSEDYRTLLDGRTLEVSKRLHIIINSPHFHLFFFILHIKPKPWKEFFKEFLIFDEHTITTQFSDRIQDRRRSPPLKAFVEDCVTRLTEEDQDILFQLNLRLEDNEKIRIVSLVLRYGWDFVLNEIRVGGLNCYEDLQDLPLFTMTTEEFKTKYGVVDINNIIKRSTILYPLFVVPVSICGIIAYTIRVGATQSTLNQNHISSQWVLPSTNSGGCGGPGISSPITDNLTSHLSTPTLSWNHKEGDVSSIAGTIDKHPIYPVFDAVSVDDESTNIKIIAIGDSAVATSPVGVVIEYTTDSTASNKDQIHEGTELSPTMDCMFVATDTCIICNSTCWEYVDNTEIDIKTEDGNELVSEGEDTKEEATTGEENESNDRELTSSFLVWCVVLVCTVLSVLLSLTTESVDNDDYYLSDEEENDDEFNEFIAERKLILADAKNLKTLAVHYLHPEKPVDGVDATVFGRNYFGRASAPTEYDDDDNFMTTLSRVRDGLVVQDMEDERNAIMEDLKQLKTTADWYLHPEKPIVLSDATACGRNYFTRPSAPEYDDDEEDDMEEERYEIQAFKNIFGLQVPVFRQFLFLGEQE
ncbi:hypothetical protein FRACYDRAFT_264489 [Fragilariopsis cylindrus CCMP1102]|uniref:Uncharacterized protein n=1 Tax=Fragilariopsis cylindrus CCMP1102 TaxID=635003 RepID=A0A1E7ERN6_9STRA|nr:hypothetical protein FRACYDRAFT_264489 [Fragilariopsis cylindrus CCMP1102]|eukprot:OEU08506.1 hypothetical protein FRACYDRAFT_264489 [Fragilariopsis cylindrus CCMP1102]